MANDLDKADPPELTFPNVFSRAHYRGDRGSTPPISSPPCASCSVILKEDESALTRLATVNWRPELCPHGVPDRTSRSDLKDPGQSKTRPATSMSPQSCEVLDVPVREDGGAPPRILVLAVELSILIFDFVIRSEDTLHGPWIPPTTLFKLMLVCRHWRSVAISNASFWRYIDTTRPASWVALCLMRSRASLLDVYIIITTRQPMPSAALDLLIPHTHRFRALAARLPRSCSGHCKYWTRLRPLFQAGMPELERLELLPVVAHRPLRYGTTCPGADEVGVYALQQQDLPRLRWLTAGGVPLAPPARLWNTLRALTLYDYRAVDGAPHTFADLVTVLAQNPALEEMHVRQYAAGRFVSPVGPVPHARLPSLKRFSLHGESTFIDELNSCLVLPKDVMDWDFHDREIIYCPPHDH